MFSKNLSGGGRIDSSRPYVSPAVEVVGVDLNSFCVLVGSNASTESLYEENFEM